MGREKGTHTRTEGEDAAAASSSPGSLTRVIVTESGECKAQFEDNTICLLDPTGAALTIITPGGEMFRQRTEFAQTRFARHAATVLAFRNMYMEQPYFSAILCGYSGTSLFQTRRLVRFARWPKSASLAVDTGAAEVLADGSVSVKAEEDTARLVLPPNGVRFTIVYPLLVGENRATGAFEYFWQLQTFSCKLCPERWRPALQLAEDVMDHVKSGECSSEPHQESRRGDAAGEAGGVGEGEGYLVRRSELPRSLSFEEATWQDVPEGSWWMTASDLLYPQGVALAMEWTAAALCQYLPDEREVEAVVAADSSCLVSFQGGKFFTHARCGPGAGAPTTYAADVVPQHARSADGLTRYAVGPIVTRAAAFRAHVTIQSPGKGDEQHPQVAAEGKLPWPGEFEAYEDGRLRVKFEDRTILDMDGAHKFCKLILRDGQVAEVRVENPVGVEEYVKVAAEFAMWAFSSPEDHAHEEDLQHLVAQEILSNKCAAQLAAFEATDGRCAPAPAPVLVCAEAAEGAGEPPGGLLAIEWGGAGAGAEAGAEVGAGAGAEADAVDWAGAEGGASREAAVQEMLDRNRRMLEALLV